MWQPLHRLVCWIKCLHFLSLVLKVCSVELFARSLENNEFRSVTFDPYTVCCAPPQNCYWCLTCSMEKDQELGLLSAQALFILRQGRFPLVSHGRANIARCCSLRYDATFRISAFLRKAAMQGALHCIIAPTCCRQGARCRELGRERWDSAQTFPYLATGNVLKTKGNNSKWPA